MEAKLISGFQDFRNSGFKDFQIGELTGAAANPEILKSEILIPEILKS